MTEIKKEVWDEFYKELEKQKASPKGNSRINDNPSKDNSQTNFMQKVCSQIKISEIAQNYLIDDQCPECKSYIVNFDDYRGWFCCQDHKCSFKGNIVDFIYKCRRKGSFI